MTVSRLGTHYHRVDAPRSTDALASTLRSAFADVPGLTADMVNALQAIDRADAIRRG